MASDRYVLLSILEDHPAGARGAASSTPRKVGILIVSTLDTLRFRRKPIREPKGRCLNFPFEGRGFAAFYIPKNLDKYSYKRLACSLSLMEGYRRHVTNVI